MRRVIGNIFLYNSVTLSCIYAIRRRAAGAPNNWRFTVCLRHPQPGSRCCPPAVNKLEVTSVRVVVFGHLNLCCIKRDAASLCRGVFFFIFFFLLLQINPMQHVSKWLRCVIFILQAALPAGEEREVRFPSHGKSA